MRYEVWSGNASGNYYVSDTQLKTIVLMTKSEDEANWLVSYMEKARAELSVPASVPADVVERLKLDAAVSEIRSVELFDRAENASIPVVKDDSEREAVKLRQHANDIYTLLKAVGVELER
jgi:hypothetical protein